jgi:hypothetical protein
MKKFCFYILFTLPIIFISCKKNDGPANVPNPPYLLKGEMSAFYMNYNVNQIRAQVTLSWTDSSKSTVGYKIERKSDTSGFKVVGAVSGNNTIYKDFDLLVNSVYTYRISSYNAKGTSEKYSNVINLVTAFVPKIATKPVSDTSGISAVCGGEIVDDGAAVITEKGVVWDTLPNPTINLSTKTTEGNSIGAYFSTLTNLKEYTKYYVRAYATNRSGTGYGEVLSFTTNDINIKKDLIVHYPFNGSAGDSSSNGYHGTANNTTLFEDRLLKANRSYKFDNYSSFITAPLLQLLNYKQQLTFSFWIYSDYLFPLSPGGIFSHWLSTGNPVASVGINIGLNGINTPNPLSVVVKMSNTGFAMSTSNVLKPWVWQNITILYDGLKTNPADRLVLYVDGVNKGSFGNKDIPTFTNNIANTTMLGATTGVNGGIKTNYYKGAMDEFRIYNRILPLKEIEFIARH